MSRIGIDLDGVVYNFEDKLREYIHKSTGRPLDTMPAPDNWDFFLTQWGLTNQEYLNFIVDGVKAKEIFWRGNQIPGALDGVSELYRSGYEIVFITARHAGIPDEVQKATKYWLGANGFPYHELIFSADKTGQDVVTLLDDSPSNYDHRAHHGLHTTVFHQLWNDHIENADRMFSWQEFVDFIKKTYAPGCYSEVV